jgi:hypothetical protein
MPIFDDSLKKIVVRGNVRCGCTVRTVQYESGYHLIEKNALQLDVETDRRSFAL